MTVTTEERGRAVADAALPPAEQPAVETGPPAAATVPLPPLAWPDDEPGEDPGPRTSWLARFATAKRLGGW